MAVTPFSFTNHFQLVGHFLGNANQESWRSEFSIAASVIPQPTDAIVLAIRDYFRHNLRTDCTLDRLELRQWTVGAQPLAGRGSIWIDPLQLTGEKVTTYGGQQAPPALTGKEVVAFIKINTTNGKPGKQFLRQLYDLGDIGAVAGAPWETLPSARVTPATYIADAAPLLAPYILPNINPGIVIVHFSLKNWTAAPTVPNQPFSTGATSMELIGPSTNRPTRKSKR